MLKKNKWIMGVIFPIYIFILFLLHYSTHYQKWPDGKIFYYFENFTHAEKVIIKKGMKEWEKTGCIKFCKVKKPKTKKERIWKYRIIKSQDKNSSTIGYSKYPECKLVNIFSYKVILHELGHCLGLTHEHQRRNRDIYVKIYYENIIYKKIEHNFLKGDNNLVDGNDFPYDYNSIMGYTEYTFSKNKKKTIQPLKVKKINNNYISEIDILKIKSIYCDKNR